jgi:hypothetical protein
MINEEVSKPNKNFEIKILEILEPEIFQGKFNIFHSTTTYFA